MIALAGTLNCQSMGFILIFLQGLKWSASVRIPITHASLDDCQNIKTCLIQLHAFESNCKYGISSLIGWAFSRLLTDSSENAPLPKICHTYPTIMKIGIPYLKNIQKIYKSSHTPVEFCWHQHFFPKISNFTYIKKYRFRLNFSASF